MLREKRDVRFTFLMTNTEDVILNRLGRHLNMTRAETMRYLLGQGAKEYGLAKVPDRIRQMGVAP